MNTQAHHLVFALLILALLIQTARAGYWRGYAKEGDGRQNDLAEEINSTRNERDGAQRIAREQREFIHAQYERLTMRQAAPELMDELMQANGLLRSCHAIAERDGESTNWRGLQSQLSQRLKAQQAMLYAPPAS